MIDNEIYDAEHDDDDDLHYANVGLDEKRAAVANVIQLVPTSGMDAGMDADRNQ